MLPITKIVFTYEMLLVIVECECKCMLPFHLHLENWMHLLFTLWYIWFLKNICCMENWKLYFMAKLGFGVFQ